jgi:hypothetical protein
MLPAQQAQAAAVIRAMDSSDLGLATPWVEPGFTVDCGERRMAGRALAAWEARQGRQDEPVPGFAEHSMIVGDPAGAALIEAVGRRLAATFLFEAGRPLARGPGLATELSAACELVALHPEPVPFEASVDAPNGAQLMVRGIALPLMRGDDQAGAVQIVCNWREVLSRSAARRLRRELGAALRDVRAAAPQIDPFQPNASSR